LTWVLTPAERNYIQRDSERNDRETDLTEAALWALVFEGPEEPILGADCSLKLLAYIRIDISPC
jgi:hypothetical protein